jgi:hypothetical protein
MPAALRPGVKLIYPDWPAPPHIVAFSTTRESGDEARPARLDQVPVPAIQQVHGNLAIEASAVGSGTRADAVFTRQAGIACRVVTADCLPILLCDAAGGGIAAVHAGWRGLAAGVLENTLDALNCTPDTLMAWIGPAISQSCYEVGAEVLEAFIAAAPDGLEPAIRERFQPRAGKYLADLPGLARLKLAYRGVQSVYGGAHCTYSDARRFHSWRRDGAAAGRIASVICMLETPR